MESCAFGTRAVNLFTVGSLMVGSELLTFHAPSGFLYVFSGHDFFTFDDKALLDGLVGCVWGLEGEEDKGGGLARVPSCSVFEVSCFNYRSCWEVVGHLNLSVF